MFDIDFNNFPFTFKDKEMYGTIHGFFKTPSSSHYQGRIVLVNYSFGTVIVPIRMRRSYYIFK